MSAIPIPKLLPDFVDRTSQLSDFRAMADTGSGVLCLWGPGGIGKSTLVSRLTEECQARNVQWVTIEWRDSRRYGYLDFMRRIRDAIGSEPFFAFNDVVNFYTVPEYRMRIEVTGAAIREVNVAVGDVKDSKLDVHVGHRIEVRDMMVQAQRPDQGVSEETVMIEITDAFFRCLAQFLKGSRLVVFCDAIEKADQRMKRWLCDELLSRARDGELQNLVIVLASREGLPIDPSMARVVLEHEIRGLEAEHVREYLARKGVPDGGVLAEFLADAHAGNPLHIATAVNAFLRVRAGRGARG